MPNTILVADDDPVQRRLLDAALSKAGHIVLKADDGVKAISYLKNNDEHNIDAIILDLNMPNLDGMGVMREMNEAGIEVPVIVQTATGGIETVVEAMRLGAFDFVVKPVSPERLQNTVKKALRLEVSKSAVKKVKKQTGKKFSFKDIISTDVGMEKILRIGQKAANSQIPVLIEGESGVGKELIARAIQSASDRAHKPLVTVNCGALPENLVESILFGHEKGAFTGATDKHAGKFVEADGGTLFLDEIGELPLDLQVKLLRAIQEGTIDPIGSKNSVKVDIRLISATNRDLLNEVKEGRFREDLYYRLNVLPMNIPPLRERAGDIPALVYHFVKRICQEENRSDISAVNSNLMKALSAHSWPGNIRELENAVFRAIVLCDGEELSLEDFPQIASQMPDFQLEQDPNMIGEIYVPSMVTPIAEPAVPSDLVGLPAVQNNFEEVSNEPVPATGTYGMVKLISPKGQIRKMNDVEREMIEFALEIYNGKMSEVARRLGIGRSTLYRKIKELGLEEDRTDEVA